MENLQKNWDRNLAQSLNMGEKELVAQESKTKTCRFIFILFFFDSPVWNIQPRHWRLRRSTENVQRDHPEMACIFTAGEHQTLNWVHIPAWDNENNGLKICFLLPESTLTTLVKWSHPVLAASFQIDSQTLCFFRSAREGHVFRIEMQPGGVFSRYVWAKVIWRYRFPNKKMSKKDKARQVENLKVRPVQTQVFFF